MQKEFPCHDVTRFGTLKTKCWSHVESAFIGEGRVRHVLIREFSDGIEVLHSCMKRTFIFHSYAERYLRCIHWNTRVTIIPTLSSFSGGTRSCYNDKPRCHQWRQSWHHGNNRFSVIRMEMKAVMKVHYFIKLFSILMTLWTLERI